MRYIPKRDAAGHFIPVITNRVKLCKFCGKEFTPSIKNFARNKFCSASCASKSHPSGRTGKTNNQHQKDMVSLKTTGEKHFAWKGDDVGYFALHSWVRRNLGKAVKCEHCGKEWNGPKSIQWANKSHEYKRDLTDWLSLCVKCHKKYDGF